MSINERETTILQFILRMKHPTAKQIHTYAFPRLQKSQVYRLLKHLQEKKYLSSQPIIASQTRYYQLRRKGAKTLGLAAVPRNHYIPEPNPSYRTYLDIWITLHGEADLAHCQLFTKEADIQLIMKKATYGKNIPQGHSSNLYSLIPSRIRPGMLLLSPHGLYLCFIPHPASFMKKTWKERIFQKYHHHLPSVRIVICCLHKAMQEECKKALYEYIHTTQAFHLREKFLILSPAGIPAFFEHVQGN